MAEADAIRIVSFGANNLAGWEAGDKGELCAVLLIQEWWGITEIVKQQAILIASRGYRVLIPDLYLHTKLCKETGRTTAFDREEASHSMNTLDFKVATHEIGEAAAYLRETGSPIIAICGGCMGGALAFAAAEKVPGLACAAPAYGTIEPLAGHLKEEDGSPYFQVERIKIPVSYHVGAEDFTSPGFSDPITGQQVITRMQTAGCQAECHIYSGTAHSFLNALVPGGVNFLEKWGYGVPPQEQVQSCFENIVQFLDLHCKGKAAVS